LVTPSTGPPRSPDRLRILRLPAIAELDQAHRRHVLNDLDITTEQVTPERSISVAPVVDAVRNGSGAASLGYLATLVDVNCALVALIPAHPDWTATAALTLHGVDPLTVGPTVVDSRLVRAGRNIITISVSVSDGRGVDPFAQHDSAGAVALASDSLVTAARGLVTFARIPRGATRASTSFDPRGVVGQRRSLSPAGDVPEAGLADRLGLRIVDPVQGCVELPISDYVRNSFGAINGGVMAMLVQAAAEAALEEFVATDLQVHYLAQAPGGQARAVTTVLRRGDEHAVCLVDVLAAEQAGRRLAQASVVLERTPDGPTASRPSRPMVEHAPDDVV
jgi:acyl-coenzyme A thioesterase PaaI-like protein